MYEIVEQEYQKFLYDIGDNGELKFGRYVDESDYEDEYSHDEIEVAKGAFNEKVKVFLHENYPGKYVVSISYCVFVMTKDSARGRKFSEKTIRLFTID